MEEQPESQNLIKEEKEEKEEKKEDEIQFSQIYKKEENSNFDSEFSNQNNIFSTKVFMKSIDLRCEDHLTKFQEDVEATRFCQKCNILVCDSCVIDYHIGHIDFAKKKVDDYFLAQKNNIIELKNKVKDSTKYKINEKEIDKIVSNQKKLVEDFFSRRAEESQIFIKKFENLQNIENEIKDSMLKSIDIFYKDECFKRLQNPIEKNEFLGKKIDSFIKDWTQYNKREKVIALKNNVIEDFQKETENNLRIIQEEMKNFKGKSLDIERKINGIIDMISKDDNLSQLNKIYASMNEKDLNILKDINELKYDKLTVQKIEDIKNKKAEVDYDYKSLLKDKLFNSNVDNEKIKPNVDNSNNNNIQNNPPQIQNYPVQPMDKNNNNNINNNMQPKNQYPSQQMDKINNNLNNNYPPQGQFNVSQQNKYPSQPMNNQNQFSSQNNIANLDNNLDTGSKLDNFNLFNNSEIGNSSNNNMPNNSNMNNFDNNKNIYNDDNLANPYAVNNNNNQNMNINPTQIRNIPNNPQIIPGTEAQFNYELIIYLKDDKILAYNEKSGLFSLTLNTDNLNRIPDKSRFVNLGQSALLTGGMTRENKASVKCYLIGLIENDSSNRPNYSINISPYGDLKEGRERHNLIYLPNKNFVFACGGFFSKTCEYSDVYRGNWELIAPMNKSRGNASMAYVNDRFVYIMGGFELRNDSPKGNYLNDLEFFDINNFGYGWRIINFSNPHGYNLSLTALGIVPITKTVFLICGGFDGREYKNNVYKVDCNNIQYPLVEESQSLNNPTIFTHSMFCKIRKSYFNFDFNGQMYGFDYENWRFGMLNMNNIQNMN